MLKTKLLRVLLSPLLLLFLSFFFLVYWFSFLISSQPWPSSDLPFHINTIINLKSLWYEGVYSYYDPYTFTGWPALQFYGFIPFLSTVFLSYLFDLFTDNSVIFSINTLIVIVSSSLIFSLYYAAKPFFNDLFDDFSDVSFLNYKVYLERLLVLNLLLFCFWFLNFDYQDFSVGIGAPLFTGLYGQMFGWHALILYVGLITRVIKYEGNKNFWFLCLSIPISFLCHTLTSIFTLLIGLLCFLWFRESRLKIFKAHILGFGILGFWLIPLLQFMGEYTIFYPKEQADFLGIILRYPIIDFIKSIISTLSGDFVLINYTFLLIWLLIFTALVSQQIRKTKLLSSFLIFILLLIALFSSGYIIRSIPIGIHYYRFTGMIMLMIVLLFSVVSLSWYKKLIRFEKYQKGFSIIYVSIILICFLFNLFIPHTYLAIFKSNKELIADQFKDRQKLLNYFIEENSEGRVYFEYLNQYKKHKPLFSHHFLPSLIYRKTGYESIVGVQILQSKSYRYIIERMSMLDAFTYTSDKLNSKINIGLNDKTIINQLKSFGITHLVSGTNQFFQRVSKFSIDEVVEIDSQKIIKIQETPFKKIDFNKKQLIGFFDNNGNLPFSLVDHYFFSTEFLTNNFELIEIKEIKSIPDQLSALIVNDNDELKLTDLKLKVFNINFVENYSKINHYKPLRKEKNSELYLYREIANYFENFFDIQEKLKSVIKDNKKILNDEVNNIPELEWSPNNQKFKLSNLHPGYVYRINYSYFPYWHTYDGVLLRGSGERMFFIPKKSTASFKYTRLYSYSTWIGWLLTILSFVYLILFHTTKKLS